MTCRCGAIAIQLQLEWVKKEASMYVCLCNGLKDKHFEGAAASGADSVEALYACHGCAPQCGNCVDYVEMCYMPANPKTAASSSS